MRETGVYIHIPFCDHKCIYCDFYSIITSDNINPFLNSVKKEIEYYSRLYSDGRKIVSIFFGGGTPSLMSPAYLEEIISTVKKNFYTAEDLEITMESNPGTLDYNKMGEFKDAGINRISIGIQSFHDDELRFLTRIHDSKTASLTVLNAERAGFRNISIDLIFNLPGQSREKWKYNLETAAALPVKHISSYSLILEKGTILNKMVLDGKVSLQDDDYDADLYTMTMDYLTNKGFLQYEVSNFARPGYECIHNNCYWRYKDYFGFGPSAHSFINGKRWWNYSSLKAYILRLEDEGCSTRSSEEPGKAERLNEYIMLTLRSSGTDLSEVKKHFDTDWFSRNRVYLELLEKHNFIAAENNFIKLTPAGYAVCDEILKNLK